MNISIIYFDFTASYDNQGTLLSLSELFDIFLLDLGKLASDLGVEVFEGAIGVFHEDVLEV